MTCWAHQPHIIIIQCQKLGWLHIATIIIDLYIIMWVGVVYGHAAGRSCQVAQSAQWSIQTQSIYDSWHLTSYYDHVAAIYNGLKEDRVPSSSSCMHIFTTVTQFPCLFGAFNLIAMVIDSCPLFITVLWLGRSAHSLELVNHCTFIVFVCYNFKRITKNTMLSMQQSLVVWLSPLAGGVHLDRVYAINDVHHFS